MAATNNEDGGYGTALPPTGLVPTTTQHSFSVGTGMTSHSFINSTLQLLPPSTHNICKRRMRRAALFSSLLLFYSTAFFDGCLRCAAAGFTGSSLHKHRALLGDTRRYANNKKVAGVRKKGRANIVVGGFGTTASKKGKGAVTDTGDYSVFPRLEPNVLGTLVPSTKSTLDPALAEEMFHRLDQIYGFSNFNFHGDAVPKEDQVPVSATLTEILSVQSNPPIETSSTPLSAVLHAIPAFSEFRVLHVDPLVLAIDNFMTMEECDSYVERSLGEGALFARSPTVGKDAAAQAQRTSTTWYHHFSDVPELMAKATRLLGLSNIDHWEEPQTVRYRRNEKFTWHLDALGPSECLAELGGQRIATLLVYLTDLKPSDGGATLFRDLRGADGDDTCLRVQPQKGSALLFFPSAGGIPSTPFDIRTLHCGEVVSAAASQDKWIAQLWLRHGVYKPTAPPGNEHESAIRTMADYCACFK